MTMFSPIELSTWS